MSKSRLTSMVLLLISVSTVLLIRASMTFAQDECPSRMETIRIGETVMGRISENAPVAQYCFEARSGEEIRIDLLRDSGSLDPYLEITNIAGDKVYMSNDDRSLSTTDAQIIFLVPETSTYVIHATRFDRENGTTQGTYNLTMQSDRDQASEPKSDDADTRPDGCPILYDSIRYDDSVEDVIDDDAFSYYFCFIGTKGDEVVIDAVADEDDKLDTILILTDLRFEDVLAENDDVRLGNRDSRIIYVLPETGAYLITLSRYNFDEGTGEGRFTLSLKLNDGTIPSEDIVGQVPQAYECNRPLIKELNATQWLEADTDYDFRLNFGCEGLAAVSILGGMFTTPYSFVDGDLQVTFNDQAYNLDLESKGSLTAKVDGNESFVFSDVGDCSDSLKQDLIEGVWFLEENTTFFRLDFMCNDVVLITFDSSTEVYSYDYNTTTDVLTIAMDEPLIWTDVFILPGSYMSVETEDDPYIFTNILVEIEDSDEADI